MKAFLSLALVVGTSWATAAGETPRFLLELEQLFGKTVAGNGISPGFVEFLADDGYIFLPQPILGQAWHRTNSSPGRLVWEPELAVLSAGGDLGYTTGPWKYFADRTSSEAIANGHYFSVWQRQTNGNWRVAADIGVSYPPTEGSAGRPALRTLASRRKDVVASESLAQGLTDEDRLAAVDRGDAVSVSDSVRVYRARLRPFVGRLAAEQAWREHGRLRDGKAARVLVSQGGTLGCTLGTGKLVLGPVADENRVDASYLRVWEWGEANDWKLAAEIVLPWPAKSP